MQWGNRFKINSSKIIRIYEKKVARRINVYNRRFLVFKHGINKPYD